MEGEELGDIVTCMTSGRQRGAVPDHNNSRQPVLCVLIASAVMACSTISLASSNHIINIFRDWLCI